MANEFEIKDIPSAVIGLGASGIASAVYLARMGVDPVCFESGKVGGKLNEAGKILNYPGFAVTGAELIADMEKQLESNHIEIKREKVLSLTSNPSDAKEFIICTEEGTYRTPAVVIATGTDYVIPQVDGIEKITDLISHAPISDREKAKAKDIIVWGSDDITFQAATELAEVASSVTVVYKDDSNCSKAVIDSFEALINTTRQHGTISKIERSANSFKATVRHVDGSFSSLYGSYLFILMGAKQQLANTDFVKIHEIKDDQGNIAVDKNSCTFVKGIFAAGDVVQKSLRNLAVDASDGAMAGIMAYRYIMDLKK